MAIPLVSGNDPYYSWQRSQYHSAVARGSTSLCTILSDGEVDPPQPMQVVLTKLQRTQRRSEEFSEDLDETNTVIVFSPCLLFCGERPTKILSSERWKQRPNDKRMRWWREVPASECSFTGVSTQYRRVSTTASARSDRRVIIEWANIPRADYEKFALQFNPVSFNAKEWVRIAKEAGMKYIVITSKHHDGFAMYGSKVSKYDIVDATPYHRDPIKELAAEAKKQGLVFCFYYSILDWHYPAAYVDAPGKDPTAGNRPG